MPQTLFALVIFPVRSYIFAQATLDCHLPIYTSHVAGMTPNSAFIG
jgi:hypothetical protein